MVLVCVSRQGLWRTDSLVPQDKELQEEVTGESTSVKEESNTTDWKIVLLAAKEIVRQTHYFSAESISAGFLTPLCPSTPFAPPHPHPCPLPLLHYPTLNSEETKGVQAGSRHS